MLKVLGEALNRAMPYNTGGMASDAAFAVVPSFVIQFCPYWALSV